MGYRKRGIYILFIIVFLLSIVLFSNKVSAAAACYDACSEVEQSTSDGWCVYGAGGFCLFPGSLSNPCERNVNCYTNCTNTITSSVYVNTLSSTDCDNYAAPYEYFNAVCNSGDTELNSTLGICTWYSGNYIPLTNGPGYWESSMGVYKNSVTCAKTTSQTNCNCMNRNDCSQWAGANTGNISECLKHSCRRQGYNEPTCGDGVTEIPNFYNQMELCDGSDLNGQTCTSILGRPSYGSLVCNDACRFDISGCGFCNDSIIQTSNEQCDTGTQNGVFCSPFYGGNCTYCTSTCQNGTILGGSCGDMIKNGAEQCDASTSLLFSPTQRAAPWDGSTWNVCDDAASQQQFCIEKGYTNFVKGAQYTFGNCLNWAGSSWGSKTNTPSSGVTCSKSANGAVCSASYGGSCTYCSSSCTNISVTGSYCGDGKANTSNGEQCDGADLAGQNCSTATGGLNPVGLLKCTAGCLRDTSNCSATQVDPCSANPSKLAFQSYVNGPGSASGQKYLVNSQINFSRNITDNYNITQVDIWLWTNITSTFFFGSNNSPLNTSGLKQFNWTPFNYKYTFGSTPHKFSWLYRAYDQCKNVWSNWAYTVDVVKCLADTDCGFCQKCDIAGGTYSCISQSVSEDTKNQCPTDICANGFCNGAGACSYYTPSTVCRSKNGPCDIQENCSGTASTCIAPDLSASFGTVCSACAYCNGFSCVKNMTAPQTGLTVWPGGIGSLNEYLLRGQTYNWLRSVTAQGTCNISYAVVWMSGSLYGQYKAASSVIMVDGSGRLNSSWNNVNKPGSWNWTSKVPAVFSTDTSIFWDVDFYGSDGSKAISGYSFRIGLRDCSVNSDCGVCQQCNNTTFTCFNAPLGSDPNNNCNAGACGTGTCNGLGACDFVDVQGSSCNTTIQCSNSCTRQFHDVACDGLSEKCNTTNPIYITNTFLNAPINGQICINTSSTSMAWVSSNCTYNNGLAAANNCSAAQPTTNPIGCFAAGGSGFANTSAWCSFGSACSIPTPFCSSGSCKQCIVNADCDDLNSCTNETCSSGVCIRNNRTTGFDCGGLCQSCNGLGTCINTPNTLDYQAECSDSQMGTCAGDYCSGSGNCTMNITRGAFCTACKFCDGLSFTCANAAINTDPNSICVPNWLPCTNNCTRTYNNDLCNGFGSCASAVNTTFAALGFVCTNNPINSTNTALSCSNYCAVGSRFCVSGSVANETRYACNGFNNNFAATPNVSCQVQVCSGGQSLCDPASGNCVQCYNDAQCDDGVQCTIDTCNLGTHTCNFANAPIGTDCGGTCQSCNSLGACIFTNNTDYQNECTSGANNCTADVCNGLGSCAFKNNTNICRNANGGCDVDDFCNGASYFCGADNVRANGFVCRITAGICDTNETCNGVLTSCPVDAFNSSSQTCRSANGQCDIAENCTGVSATCSAPDSKRPSQYQCGSLCQWCDGSGTCIAESNNTDIFNQCPGAFGTCAGDICNGLGNCTINSTAQRSSLCGTCKTCDGSGFACANILINSDPRSECAPIWMPCTDNCTRTFSNDVCNGFGSCSATSNTTPAALGFVCRDIPSSSTNTALSCSNYCAVGPKTCTGDDVYETRYSCDGLTNSFAVSPAVSCFMNTCSGGTHCNPANGQCVNCTSDAQCGTCQKCNLGTNACVAQLPSEDLKNECTFAASGCIGDFCNGAGTGCAFQPSSVQCRARGANGSITCDMPENCSGSSYTCGPDLNVTTGTDPFNECAASFTFCTGSCQRDGPDGNCNGGRACKTTGSLTNILSGNICAGSGNQTLLACGNQCFNSTNFCFDNVTVAKNASSCNGGGSCSGPITACAVQNCAGGTPRCYAGSCVQCFNDTQCNDGNECTIDTCNLGSHTCTITNAPANVTDCGGTCQACNGLGACVFMNNTDYQNECTSGASNCTADVCNGLGACAFKNNTNICRASIGVCDTPDFCSGSSYFCGVDALNATGQLCRTSAGPCDSNETCTGASPLCPTDTYSVSATVCRNPLGICDRTEFCTGTGPLCPADSLNATTDMCRASAGICDSSEFCNNVAVNCPSDSFNATGQTCRVTLGICDKIESCTGIGPLCPVDQYNISGTLCRASNGICDTVDTCTGASVTCIDTFNASNQVCRPASGQCDIAENCSGVSATCSAPDSKRPFQYQCGSLCNWCDGSGSCVNQPSGSDQFNQCDSSLHTCSAPSCNGFGNCTIDTSAGASSLCSGCKFCNASSWDCVNVPANTDPKSACTANWLACTNNCTRTFNNEWCDGFGSCNFGLTSTTPAALGFVCRDVPTNSVNVSLSCSNYCAVGPKFCDGNNVNETRYSCNGINNNFASTPNVSCFTGTTCSGSSYCFNGNCVNCFNDAQCGACQKCNMVSNTCVAQLPSEDLKNDCNVTAGACIGDFCNGAGTGCAFQPSSVQCRARGANGSITCDMPENCSGASYTCGPDLNVTTGTDPFNDCALSFTFCVGGNTCQRDGPDGNCNGARSCSTTGSLANILTGNVCTGPGSQTPLSCGNQCWNGTNYCLNNITIARDGWSCNSLGACTNGSTVPCTVQTCGLGYRCGVGACNPVCGDGLINGTEQCDDGNNVSNDGCSSSCQIEPCYIVQANLTSVNCFNDPVNNLSCKPGDTLQAKVVYNGNCSTAAYAQINASGTTCKIGYSSTMIGIGNAISGSVNNTPRTATWNYLLGNMPTGCAADSITNLTVLLHSGPPSISPNVTKIFTTNITKLFFDECAGQNWTQYYTYNVSPQQCVIATCGGRQYDPISVINAGNNSGVWINSTLTGNNSFFKCGLWDGVCPNWFNYSGSCGNVSGACAINNVTDFDCLILANMTCGWVNNSGSQIYSCNQTTPRHEYYCPSGCVYGNELNGSNISSRACYAENTIIKNRLNNDIVCSSRFYNGSNQYAWCPNGFTLANVLTGECKNQESDCSFFCPGVNNLYKNSGTMYTHDEYMANGTLMDLLLNTYFNIPACFKYDETALRYEFCKKTYTWPLNQFGYDSVNVTKNGSTANLFRLEILRPINSTLSSSPPSSKIVILVRGEGSNGLVLGTSDGFVVSATLFNKDIMFAGTPSVVYNSVDKLWNISMNLYSGIMSVGNASVYINMSCASGPCLGSGYPPFYVASDVENFYFTG